MNTRHLLGSVGLVCTTVIAGSAFAEVGIRDGADQFSDFRSTATRAEVQRDLYNAKGQGTSISMRDGDDKLQGAHGVAGSRYSALTREEVQAELANSHNQPQGNRLDSLYFGD